MASSTAPSAHRALCAATEKKLRHLDLLLVAVVLPLLAIPLMLAAWIGRWHREVHLGRDGCRFKRHRLVLPSNLLGRCFAVLGATHWPDLLHILRGDMSWVGPQAHRAGSGFAAPPVRPGLTNSWRVRRRTAIDFDGEQIADLEDLDQRSPRHHLGLLLRAVWTSWLGSPAEAPPAKVRLCDVVFDNVDMRDALQRIEKMLDGKATAQVCFVNPACVNIAARHRGYRRTLARAALVLPDGIGTKIAGSILGTPLKQNVNGTDLFPRLCALLESRKASVFLLGGQVGVAERVAREIERRWPGVRIAGLRDGFFSVADEGAVAEQVRASGADVLFVARGVPSQDLLVDRHLDAFGVKVAIGVGGLFDFISGRIKRAPMWMREMGLEWSYRLLQEPSRMWRRYLLGNFTFLARIVLQRLGLRPAAPDIHEPLRSASTTQTSSATRVVLFATQSASPDLPVHPGHPAALLPLAHTTVIERQIAQLAQVGIKEVDVVLCVGPEMIRERLDEGRSLGVRIHWHVVKDPDRPYAILRSAPLQAAHRVIIGHVDAWIPDHAVRALHRQDQWAAVDNESGGRVWAAWSSAAPALWSRLSPDSERHAIETQLQRGTTPAFLIDAVDCVLRIDAAGLLRAQALAERAGDATALPPSWLRKPWGACSPLAYIHPAAEISGPVFVGPGCVVQAGATLGAHTWLSSDVVVSSGSSLTQTVVMPGTYIGSGLELTQAVVNGGRVRHLAYDVETMLPSSDALLASLKPVDRTGGSLSGRTLAAVAIAVLGLPVLPSLALRAVAGQPWPWVKRHIVVGREEHRPGLMHTVLRCPRSTASGTSRVLANYGALLDVALGRRTWFGMRARTAAQWYAISADWQHLLSRVPIGLVHQPAWADDDAALAEAEVAADVFHIAHRGWRARCHLIVSTAVHWLARRPPTSGVRPVWQPRAKG